MNGVGVGFGDSVSATIIESAAESLCKVRRDDLHHGAKVLLRKLVIVPFPP